MSRPTLILMASLIASPALAQHSAPRDLSPWAMFMGADMVVKAVMIALALASLATWTIAFAKGVELRKAKRAIRAVSASLDEETSLADARAHMRADQHLARAMIDNAIAELALSQGARLTGTKERLASRLDDIERAAARRIAVGTGILASIGSTSPFVGLFGTVWGIMNSFVGIAKTQTTNLAVVAPGIAEALLATALGLVAAIPAVLVYNACARSIGEYRSLVSEAAAKVARLASREIDRTPSMRIAAE